MRTRRISTFIFEGHACAQKNHHPHGNEGFHGDIDFSQALSKNKFKTPRCAHHAPPKNMSVTPQTPKKPFRKYRSQTPTTNKLCPASGGAPLRGAGQRPAPRQVGCLTGALEIPRHLASTGRKAACELSVRWGFPERKRPRETPHLTGRVPLAIPSLL